MDLFISARDLVTGGLGEPQRRRSSPAVVVEVAAQLGVLWDNLSRRIFASRPPRQPVACAEGCAACCHKMVGATSLEVIGAAAAASGLGLKAVLLEARDRIRGLGPVALASGRFPCPFLAPDRRCRIYAARPLACRALFSASRTACDRALAEPSGAGRTVPYYRWTLEGKAAVLRGIMAGLATAGLDASYMDLVGGAALVVECPETVDAWLAGEAVFSPLALDERSFP
jgi:hypothetical protein